VSDGSGAPLCTYCSSIAQEPPAQQQRSVDDLVKQNADEPYFFAGNTTGCLVLHGFGGSPREAHALGAHLASAGFTVSGARLAGHGGTTSEFYSSRSEAWLESAQSAFNELRTICSRVIIVGFSLGGGLGLQIARRQSYAGLVTMGSRVLPVADRRPTASRLLHSAIPRLDPSSAAHRELRAAVANALAALPHVQVPALIMHGRSDDTVTMENAQAIFEGIAAEHKELVLWDSTGHDMFSAGPHRRDIFERVSAFVESLATS
jgi:carboxylesterase